MVGLDGSSPAFDYILENIYKKAEEEDLGKSFLNSLDKNKNQNYGLIYIRILGVIGEKEAVDSLIRLFKRYQKNEIYEITFSYLVDGLGLIGDKSAVYFLEDLLKKKEKENIKVPGSTIACALYLITGNSDYSFVNSFGREQKLILTKEIDEARKIIVKSHGRRRTYKEMKELDKLFRGPSD
jgi:hypothetical protein